MTKHYNPKEKVFYYIFEKGNIFTTYRILAEILGLPTTTLHRAIKELEEEKKIRTTNEDGYTHFELLGVMKQTTIFDYPVNTDPVKFTSRQHRLVDLLLFEFDKNPNRFVPKMEVLFQLREYFFTKDQIDTFDVDAIRTSYGNEQDFLKEYYLNTLGDKRYKMKEYADLTAECLFINEHCDVRQVLIISRSGTNGGIKIAKKSEAAIHLEREQKQILKKYDRWHIKRRFLEKDGNYRFLFENDSKAKNYVAIAK